MDRMANSEVVSRSQLLLQYLLAIHLSRSSTSNRPVLPAGASRVDRMKRKLQTQAGKAVYAARKCLVEPVFGQQARGF